MRALRLVVPTVLLVTACNTNDKQQLAALARADSLRTDSLVSIKNELLNEVMTSTQFVTAINDEMAKLKSKTPLRLSASKKSESDVASIKEQRAAVLASISALVARLDSSEARVEQLRARAAQLSKRDGTLSAQVERYNKTIAELRQTVEQQRADFSETIARQNAQISALTTQVDTFTRANVRLVGEKAALGDTVSSLTAERNTAYYVIGTKDELIERGILVEEGRKRLLIIGGRPVAPARDLDPSQFTRIDRTVDRVINLPEGEYRIFSRQNPVYAAPFSSHDGKILGGLRVEEPDKFWEPSRFLILVKG